MVETACMVGIAGPSCSGKTELARRVASGLPCEDPLIFSLDDYYLDLSHLPPQERDRQNFDHPDALEASLLHVHLRALASGREIDKPVYRFETHTRAGEAKRVGPAPFVIVEGLYALYWSGIRQMLGTKVFIEAEDALCFSRRVERDVRERGRSRGFVVAQYVRHTRPIWRLAWIRCFAIGMFPDGAGAAHRYAGRAAREQICWGRILRVIGG